MLGETRLAGFPAVPTLREMGYDFSSSHHIVFMAPKGVPADVMAKLSAAFKTTMSDAAITDFMVKRSLTPMSLVGNDLVAAMKRESEAYGGLVKQAKSQ